VTTDELASAYLIKCRVRLKVLDLLLAERAWSDVVREAQELVELALKGVLRARGIDPPHVHEVSATLRLHAGRLSAVGDIEALAEASVYLRKHRELSFYGAEDLIPTAAYSEAEARLAQGFAMNATQALERALRST
jgi:hypothetical protein